MLICVIVVWLFFGPRSTIALWWLFDSLRFDVGGGRQARSVKAE